MPNNQSRLPPTHYDGLLKTDPELFASVKKDLQRGIDGPVSSVDELPNFIPYAEREMDLFMEDVADSLKNVLGYKPQEGRTGFWKYPPKLR